MKPGRPPGSKNKKKTGPHKDATGKKKIKAAVKKSRPDQDSEDSEDEPPALIKKQK
jgi:hypothetical protein